MQQLTHAYDDDEEYSFSNIFRPEKNSVLNVSTDVWDIQTTGHGKWARYVLFT